jgi:hypothetical protein
MKYWHNATGGGICNEVVRIERAESRPADSFEGPYSTHREARDAAIRSLLGWRKDAQRALTRIRRTRPSYARDEKGEK